MINRFEEFTLSIFKIAHYWNTLAAEEMKQYGLKGISALYLITLYHHEDGLTAAKLAQICSRDKADISRTIAAFNKRGWLQEKETNKYRACIKLSEAGKEVAEKLESRATLALSMAGQDLEEEKRQNMYECLALIVNQLEDISKVGLPKHDE